ncbi:MAG: DsbC family protein [Pseudomonadota bacterium]
MKARITPRILIPLLAAALLTALPASHAGEKEVRQAVQALAPGAKSVKIDKTGMDGIFEVTLDGEQGPMVIYADKNGQYLMVGELLDVKNRRNLTKERMDKLTEVKWETLPLQDAIKVVRGNGQRRLAVFSDPDCPYCKKAEQEFSKLDNVTIYTFLYPLPFHQDAARKARLVWCAKDRAQAWLDLMLKGRVPGGKAGCSNPVEKNLALGARLKVEGTPAMILANGKRIPGFVPAAQLDAMLTAAEAR